MQSDIYAFLRWRRFRPDGVVEAAKLTTAARRKPSPIVFLREIVRYGTG
jgi:hypothetical protein